MTRMAVSALIVLAAVSASRAGAASTGADFYVSPAGDDTHDGSKARPFATVLRARDAVRERVRAGLRNDLVVLIRGGTYRLEKTWTLGPADSGTKEHSITYAGYPGETVILSGGRKITGWKKGAKGTWEATVRGGESGDWRFRQLFVDGKRLPRARFPNAGELLTVDSVSDDVKTIGFKRDLIGGDWAGRDAELVMYQNWSISRAAIVSSDKRSVTTATPIGWIGHGSATCASPGKPAYLENAMAFLDQPTEWVLDRQRGVLTYQADGDEDPNTREFIAPRQPQLLVIGGRKGAPVRNLIFKGLTFEHTAWSLPAFGYSGIQAGHYGPNMKERNYVLPNAIHFSFARDCRFERCRVRHTGASGIGFGAGCRGNQVVGCDLSDIGGNGILVGWRGEDVMGRLQGDANLAADWIDPKDAPVGNAISNCVIRRCGAVNHGCVGIVDMFSAGTRISHNRVEDMPYTGISVGYRWNTSPTSQRECIVEYNHIFDVMKMLADGGGIYTLGLQPGTVLRGNLIHDAHRSAYAHGGAPNNGVFFDQGSKGYLVEGNVIYNTSGEPIRFNQTVKENLTWKENSFGPTPTEAGFPKAAADRAGLLPAYRDVVGR